MLCSDAFGSSRELGVRVEFIGILGQCYPASARRDVVVPFGTHRHYGRVAERDTSQTHQPDFRRARA